MATRFMSKGKGKNRTVFPLKGSGHKVSKNKFNSKPAKMKSTFKVPTLPNDPPRFNDDEETLFEIDNLGTVSGDPVVAIIRDFTGRRSKHKVTLDIELKRKGDTKQKGVDGKSYENELVLSISDSIWQRDESDSLSGGQGQDTLREALDDGKLEIGNGISDSQFEKLLDIWDRWHLNDLNAGTTIQKEIIEEHEDEKKYDKFDKFLDRPVAILEDFDAQPDTETEGFGEDGYSYGSQWLFEPLPDDVIEFIEEIQDKLEQTKDDE